MTGPVGAYDLTQARQAAALAAAVSPPPSGADTTIPAVRQAVVVSVDGGSPPTLTVTFDGVSNFSGIRYQAGYSPAVGDVVETVVRSGNPWVLGVNQLVEPPFDSQSYDFGTDVTHAANAGTDYITYSFTLARPAWVRVDFRCDVRPATSGNVNFTSLTVYHPTGTSVRVFNSEGTGQSGSQPQEISGWFEFYSRSLSADTVRIAKFNGGSSQGSAIFSRFVSNLFIRYR